MERKLDIPPPVTEENREQYLEELSKISEAENWVEKHSVQTNGNQEEIRIIQIDNSADEKTTFRIIVAIAISILTLIFAFYFLTVLLVIYLFNYP